MPRVLIIGGGISGIKAALTLQQHGISYLILEAQGRLGGRLKTVQGRNGKYDLGASWFHETLNNPLFDEENLLDDGKGPKWFYDDAPIRVIDENGDVSPMLKLQSISGEMDKYIELENYKDLEKDAPLYETMVRYLKERRNLLSDDQINRALEYFRRLELWHGIDTKRLSSKYASIDNEGRDALALNYDRVLERHSSQLDKSCIRLNCQVSAVKKIGSGVEVKTRQGEAVGGDYAIVTVPQSVLSSLDFEPPLPKNITNALDGVHFGALGKVVLEFEEVFWPLDAERILALATPPAGFLNSIRNDKPVGEYAGSLDSPSTWDYPSLILNFATSLGKPSFVILTQSPLTDYLEANPEKAWAHFKPTIQTLAGQKDVPDPLNVLVTDWTQNEFHRGSYSACFPGDDPLSAIMALEKGFGNVRFAGEHTILEGAGCVHGAWNSGKREADYIIKHSAD